MIAQRMIVGGGSKWESWQFTVNTAATASGEKKTGIPFNLYGQNGAVLNVDWGDGTTSRLTVADYASQGDSSASVHEYETAGIYIVLVESKSWEKISILSCTQSSQITTPTSANVSLYWWRRTLTSIDSPVPSMAGRNNYANLSSTTWTHSSNESILGSLFHFCEKISSLCAGVFDKLSYSTIANYTFRSCKSLTSLPVGVFDECINVTSFQGCFRDCIALTISSGLFDKNINAQDFSNCFYGCTALLEIPSGLFSKCTLATTFNYCFYKCSKLTELPEGLFDNNIVATNFSQCFSSCSRLTSVPSNLFVHNTAATGFSNTFNSCSALTDFSLHIGSSNVTTASDFVTAKSGANRIVYVPSGSTTQTTFNGVASTLGLTIIGE